MNEYKRFIDNIEKAIKLIKHLKMINEKLEKENKALHIQVQTLQHENQISAKMIKEIERMKLERMKIKDKIGVLLNTIGEL